MHVIYSTATADIEYVSYAPGKPTDAASKLTRRICIKGGANIAPLKGQLITPRGAVTIVSDDVMNFLEQNEAFKRHQARGFMRVEKGSKPKDVDMVAKSMTPQDASAAMTKDTIAKICGERAADIEVVVEPTESSKARMK